MADYSIGDRVEVRWKAELFDAAVIKVNPSGSVDVTYDIDGSGGIFLTAEEHGLKLLGDAEKKGGGKKKKKVCVADGCSSIGDRKGQLCRKHGAKPCSVDGCSTKAQARGLCNKHGALGECLREGCTTAAVKKGRSCFKHTVKLSCADPDCDTPQVPGKFVCIKHGAYGYCTTDACSNNAIGTIGKCKKHDRKQVTCYNVGSHPMDPICWRSHGQIDFLLVPKGWVDSVGFVQADRTVAISSHHLLLEALVNVEVPASSGHERRGRLDVSALANADTAKYLTLIHI